MRGEMMRFILKQLIMTEYEKDSVQFINVRKRFTLDHFQTFYVYRYFHITVHCVTTRRPEYRT